MTSASQVHRPRALRGRLPWAVAVFAFAPVALASAEAAGQSPWEAEQRSLAERAAREGRRPEGLLPLLELASNWGLAEAAVTHELLEGLARNRRLDAPRRAYASMLLARSFVRRGEPDAARTLLASLGFLTEFRVVGPFDNEGKEGFDEVLPPELSPLGPFDPNVSYPGKERQVAWRAYPDATTSVAYVDFDAIFRPTVNVCAFAETFVESDRAMPLTLWVGAGGAFKLWWNGANVLEDARYLEADPDRRAVRVEATKGANRLLVKVCATDAQWGVYVRVGDSSGAGPRGVSARATPEPFPVVEPARTPAGRPFATPMDTLAAAANSSGASATALENYARFLRDTGADDPAERPARNLARRAAELEPTVDRLLLAAELAEGRGETMDYVARAAALDPGHVDVLFAQANLRRTGLTPEDALPILASVADEGRDGMRAASLRADLWAELGLTDAAHAEVARVASRAPNAARWVERLAAAAEAAGRRDEVHALQERHVALQWNALGPRRGLIADALVRNDADAARAHLAAYHAASRWSASRLRWVAAIHEALGDTEAALEALVEARELAPEDAATLVDHGELLLRLDRADLAVEMLEEALVLRPQDAATRELLEQIRPQERFDEAYAVALTELLSRRRDASDFPETVLQDLTVNTVFGNGLGSSFRQFAVQLHDDEGTRRFRTYSIQFDPDSQRVDVRQARVVKRDGTVLEATQTFVQSLGEPWYRIYYDTRALVVVFPDLAPGDVVEIRYRIDDVAHRNLFADYYGDLHFLQGFSPTARLDYVLVTPTSREFFFNDPGVEDLEHTQRVDGDRRVDHFARVDVPAIREESGMPGLTEVAPYLHVSTYPTWEAVGAWYWGLIADQLEPDQALRDTVAELVRGARDPAEKVRRVHRWVVENTRYVGLEFGIHGFKPYRVPLVVQRGFGDCKDKASLLYTMLELAGVEARIVLVRTRRNGAIEDLPASLAVFDHAIAYVPELDLWLDGTAEHSGTSELPVQDQGVTVLVVSPDGAALTKTPVLGPDHDQRTRRVEVLLEADGSARIDVEETVRGVEAAGYRRNYEPEGPRKDRFERALRTLFPGLVLESQSMSGLDDLESPISLRYTARVPTLAQRNGTSLNVPLSVVQELTRSLAPTPTRRHPVDLGTPGGYSEERVVSLPRGHRVAHLPQGGEASSAFGRLQLAVTTEAGRIVVRTTLEITTDRVTPAQYPAFRVWVENVDRLLGQRIELVEESAQ